MVLVVVLNFPWTDLAVTDDLLRLNHMLHPEAGIETRWLPHVAEAAAEAAAAMVVLDDAHQVDRARRCLLAPCAVNI